MIELLPVDCPVCNKEISKKVSPDLQIGEVFVCPCGKEKLQVIDKQIFAHAGNTPRTSPPEKPPSVLIGGSKPPDKGRDGPGCFATAVTWLAWGAVVLAGISAALLIILVIQTVIVPGAALLAGATRDFIGDLQASLSAALTALGQVAWLVLEIVALLALVFLVALAAGTFIVLLIGMWRGFAKQPPSPAKRSVGAVATYRRESAKAPEKAAGQLLLNLQHAYTPSFDRTRIVNIQLADAVATTIEHQAIQVQRQRYAIGGMIIGMTLGLLICWFEAKTLDTAAVLFTQLLGVGTLNVVLAAALFYAAKFVAETRKLHAAWGTRLILCTCYGAATVAMMIVLPLFLDQAQLTPSFIASTLASNVIFDVIVYIFGAAIIGIFRRWQPRPSHLVTHS